jgi:hypothetical protein
LILPSGHSAARRGGWATERPSQVARIYHETTHQTKDIQTMAKPRKIEITIQTDRRVVIYATGLEGTWCERCGGEREVVTPQTASLLTSSMFGGLENGSLLTDLHISSSSDGSPRICLESLLRLSDRENKLAGTTLSGPNAIKGVLPEK